MRHFARFAAASLIVLSSASSLAQVATTAPATRPTTKAAALPPTPEQKKIIEADRAVLPDQPAPKLDVRINNLDGAPNPNFGKFEPNFLRFHETFLKRAEQPVGLLFLGDSITAGWGKADKLFKERYDKHQIANFGIGGDRTQHVLWRLENGELDKISPKVVVLMIGTNNSGNSAERIAAGITKIVQTLRAKQPNASILLLGIFPRGEQANNPLRAKLQQVNAIISKLDDGKTVRYLEIWKQFLNEDGSMSKEIMPDFLHPSAKGYQIWADAMQPLLDEMLASAPSAK